jgi:hypothetical protein
MSGINKFVFQRQHINALRQTKEIIGGIPITHQTFGGRRSRTLGTPLQDDAAITKPQGRHRRHPRQLPPPNDPKHRRTGVSQGLRPQSGRGVSGSIGHAPDKPIFFGQAREAKTEVTGISTKASTTP